MSVPVQTPQPPPLQPQQHRRVKRQRRKLRGKYSGECLSCNAKWSKCWYIASVDNKTEWEIRLNVSVRPYADEVCFQCWDAKIRTSPKRRQTIKIDTSEISTSPDSSPNLLPALGSSGHWKTDPSAPNREAQAEFGSLSKKTNYKRSLEDDVQHSCSESSPEKVPREEESQDDSESGDEFEEQEAAFLLSTAFKTLPVDSGNGLQGYFLFRLDKPTQTL